MKLGYKQFLQHTMGVFGLCGRGTMLFAYWQCWSFFKVNLISNYESLLASFNPEFSFQYSFSSVVREEGIRTSYSLNWLHFLGSVLRALEGRASHAIGCQPPSCSSRQVCIPPCPLQRGQEAVPFPPQPLSTDSWEFKGGNHSSRKYCIFLLWFLILDVFW